MDECRILQLARSYADTIGARASERVGGQFNYVVAADELQRLIRQVVNEHNDEAEATSARLRTALELALLDYDVSSKHRTAEDAANAGLELAGRIEAALGESDGRRVPEQE